MIILNLAGVAPIVFLLLVIGSSARPFNPLPSKGDNGNRQPLQTFRPYNIAHRGSNGELPEETGPAYMVDMAIILLAKLHCFHIHILMFIDRTLNSKLFLFYTILNSIFSNLPIFVSVLWYQRSIMLKLCTNY